MVVVGVVEGLDRPQSLPQRHAVDFHGQRLPATCVSAVVRSSRVVSRAMQVSRLARAPLPTSQVVMPSATATRARSGAGTDMAALREEIRRVVIEELARFAGGFRG